MAVDGAYIYWGTRTDGTIGRADLNGGSVDNSFITGISGRTVTRTGTAVVVNSHGQLGDRVGGQARRVEDGQRSPFRPMEAAMKSLERQNRRQGKEIRALRAHSG